MDIHVLKENDDNEEEENIEELLKLFRETSELKHDKHDGVLKHMNIGQLRLYAELFGIPRYEELFENNNLDTLRELCQSFDDSQWGGTTFEPMKYPPPLLGRPKDVPTLHSLSESELFLELFGKNAIKLIIEETNKYAAARGGWRGHFEFSEEIVKIFLGYSIWMGIVRLPAISNYWSENTIFVAPTFGHRLSRDRFKEILGFLHLSDDERANKTDKLFKVRPLINILNESYQNHWSTSTDWTIDEDMIPFTGRSSFVQYLPDKPHKWGFRVWKLCDKSNYLLSFDIYAGKEHSDEVAVQPKQTLGEKVVLALIKPLQLPDQFQRLYMDNFYNTVWLTQHLLKNNIVVTGTMRKGMIGLPHIWLKLNLKMKRGDFQWVSKPSGIYSFRWMDNKEVVMITSAYSPGATTVQRLVDSKKLDIQCPFAISEYNAHMGHVDHHNQSCGYLAFRRRSYKWWHHIFFYLVQATLVNSWIIFKALAPQERSRLSLKEFQIKIVEQILSQTTENKPMRILEVHYPIKRDNRAHCACGCNGRSYFMCFECGAALKLACFSKFHSK